MKQPPCKQRSTCHSSSTGNITTSREASEPSSSPLAATAGQRGRGSYHAAAPAATPGKERGPDHLSQELRQQPQAATARGTISREAHRRRPNPLSASHSSSSQNPSLPLPAATAGRSKKTESWPS
jgi:hypothetical protein